MDQHLQDSIVKTGVTIGIIGIMFYCIILHEISHALVALWLGDDTAKRQGRMSLNPIKHIDMFGTVIMPLILYFTAGFIWGYAKPVPINPHNFVNYKRDMGLSALAGPVTNVMIAIVFALVYHLLQGFALFQSIAYMVVFFNLLLAFFNLIPIPPLDGSKVLGIFLPDQAYFKWTAQERKGMFALFIIIIASQLLGLNAIGSVVLPPVKFIMNLLGIG
ncbi:MAG: site-2 protease family protein [Candidatus Cloacimonadaceae bacterium]|nr:site-2 protease family protein [Candidatus Cloacimonadaceae bacterium]MDP3114240.1 site-2 protease family protein [Candidatus Cloacimonadaceae bacterium]